MDRPPSKPALLAADLAHLDAELSGPAALARLLAAEVPDDWPPGDWDRGAIAFFRDRLAGGAGPSEWGIHYIVDEAVDGVRRLVGVIGWFGPPDATGTAEIGFSVSATARDRGFATAALAMVLAGAGAAGARRVVARTLPDNAASIAVLRHTGFTEAPQPVDTGPILFERDLGGTATAL